MWPEIYEHVLCSKWRFKGPWEQRAEGFSRGDFTGQGGKILLTVEIGLNYMFRAALQLVLGIYKKYRVVSTYSPGRVGFIQMQPFCPQYIVFYSTQLIKHQPRDYLEHSVPIAASIVSNLLPEMSSFTKISERDTLHWMALIGSLGSST